jgi:small subunit ribosomal protein S6
MKEDTMSLYEHVVISRPDISTAQVEEFVQNLATKIENMGGSVEGAEYWGLRNLAYRMKKNRKAHYSLLKVNALPDTIHEIERQHRINEDILRYMSMMSSLKTHHLSLKSAKSARNVRIEVSHG